MELDVGPIVPSDASDAAGEDVITARQRYHSAAFVKPPLIKSIIQQLALILGHDTTSGSSLAA